jgi:Nif-specific regulatory protein
VVARLIHLGSPRAGRPFAVVNCPALQGSLLEAELFGVEKGVATGVNARPGRLEAAQGTTLLLDEIGDMSLAAQAEILRFVEDKTIERLGGRRPVRRVDVRILAATDHDLRADIDRGMFRADLFHRLNALHISLPPLSERRDDIPLLVAHFLGRCGRPGLGMGADAMDLLVAHDYPGNVRELERIVERAAILAQGPLLAPGDLPEEVRGAGGPAPVQDTQPLDAARLLLRRLVDDHESFWYVVHRPFLDRRIPRAVVERLVELVYRQAGESYR